MLNANVSLVSAVGTVSGYENPEKLKKIHFNSKDTILPDNYFLKTGFQVAVCIPIKSL